MSRQMTLWDIDSAISLPGLQDGHTPSALLDGKMIDPSGPAAAHANLSALPEKAKAHKILGTCGPSGSVSSQSAALQLSLVNKLKQRFGTGGSTLFRLTWKDSVTPSQRPVCLLRASAHRTSDSGFGSWPTPFQQDGPNGGPAQAKMSGWATPATRDFKGANSVEHVTVNSTGAMHMDQLPNQVVHLAGCPTPRAIDQPDQRGRTGNRTEEDAKRAGLTLPEGAYLSGWPTPAARDHFPAHTPEYVAEKKAQGHGMSNLNDSATLAGWQTPTSALADKGGRTKEGGIKEAMRNRGPDLAAMASLTGPARITTFGQLLTGSSAEMESGGQLNPAHSRWLMGYPVAWDYCAPITARKRK